MISIKITNRPEGPWRGTFASEASAADFERRAAKRGLVTRRIPTPAEHVEMIAHAAALPGRGLRAR